MKRRELLKAILPIAAIPLLIKGEVIGQVHKIEKDAKYVVVLSPTSRIDIHDFAELSAQVFPEGTPVFIGEEEDIKIFKL